MKNADRPRADPRRERLLVVDPISGKFREGVVEDLSELLRSADLLVVNDAATLPASFAARLVPGTARLAPTGSRPSGTHEDKTSVELRLAGTGADGAWWAVLFGEGTWRTPTEDRKAPPTVEPGDVLRMGEDLLARVEEVSPISPRLVRLGFDREGDALYRAFYQHGRPVQYSYLCCDLALWDVQTHYGARPWAVELPSAGRPLTWDALATLRRRGIRIARLTHAAGLSATGDPALDARLPLAEKYEIPPETVEAIERTRRDGGRVIAVGTTVVRALEGNAAAHGGKLVAGTGITDFILGPGTPRRVVDGLLTGVHEAGSSHLRLMEAFALPLVLGAALAFADARGFLQHEFGDSMLILTERRGRPAPATRAGWSRRPTSPFVSPAAADRCSEFDPAPLGRSSLESGKRLESGRPALA